MKRAARIVLRSLALVLLIGVGFGVYAAGLAVFGATTFAPHSATGFLLLLVGLLMLISSLIAGGGQRLTGLVALLLFLLILQPVLALAPVFRIDAPVISAIHPVNGFAILLLAHTVWRRSAQVA